jgi:multicomponent Na+:H+ antiporter subunit C
MVEFVLERAGYWAIIGLMMIGLFITFSSENLIKRMVGLAIFQTTICLFYVSLGKVNGGTAPVLLPADMPSHYGDHASLAGADALVAAGGERFADLHHVYSNPLPHVLMLTAIVVGVATLSLGLALVVRVREAYGTIEADEVREIDMQVALAQEMEEAKDTQEVSA